MRPIERRHIRAPEPWEEAMLALLGLCTIALLLACILTKRLSPSWR